MRVIGPPPARRGAWPAPARSTSDRADGTAEHLGDVRVGQVLVVPQHQRGALPPGQLGEHAPDPVTLGRIVGVVERHRLDRIGLGAQQHPPQPGAAAQVDELISQHFADVTVRGVAGGHPPPVELDADHRVLHEILRRVLVAGQHDGIPQQRAEPAVGELLVGHGHLRSYDGSQAPNHCARRQIAR
jgi:hypothetical protein